MEPKKPKQRVMYIDNAEFERALLEYKQEVKKAKKEHRERPPIPNYIGECFLKIATQLSHLPKFKGYSYRDELISDGVENCLTYYENYNPNAVSRITGKKTVGPFPYFTQIIYYAFLRRIAKENKQSYVKAKSVEFSFLLSEMSQEDMELLNTDAYSRNREKQRNVYDNIADLIKDFEDKLEKKKEKKLEKKSLTNKDNKDTI